MSYGTHLMMLKCKSCAYVVHNIMYKIDTSYMDVIVTNSHEHLISDNLVQKIGIYKYGDIWIFQKDHNTNVDLELSDDVGDANPHE
ncbi:hypothetical protein Lal_00037645 [Lupinus albus]|nr:hypothetical protein Lal_00037645 [Lupinus albus]